MVEASASANKMRAGVSSVPMRAFLPLATFLMIGAASLPGTARDRSEPSPRGRVRLTFSVETANLVEVVARAQARLDAFGVGGVVVSQRADKLIVDVPAAQAGISDDIKELLCHPYELQFSIVENASAFMQTLSVRSDNDPRARALGVSPSAEEWTVVSTNSVEHDAFLLGKRDALERYLSGLGPGNRPDRDHAIILGPVTDRPKLWRSHYVDLRTRIAIRRVDQASVRRDETNGVELSMQMLATDGDRIRALTTANIGRKMAVAIDDEVISVPVIEGAVGGKGRMTMSREIQARRLAASLLAGPLLGRLTFVSPPKTRGP